jgi:Reverse transcriptase (RNA-dependent DNA polymerase)/Endonuclease-reverse transcriptase
MNQLRILQWNVQKSKTGAMIPLLHGDTPEYDVIAIQEPWLNPHALTSYCPRSCQYSLAFPKEGHVRTCLLINKRLAPSQWTTSVQPDYCWIRITTDKGTVTIHNIYSETPPNLHTRNWNTPIPLLQQELQHPGEHLIVGDFNLHHPIWGGPGVNQWHTGSELVFELMDEYQLELITPIGLITREKSQQRSTLDLAIGTPNLAQRLVTHQVLQGLHGSDHLPLETIITSHLPVTNPLARPCWKKLDTEKLQALAKQIPPPGTGLRPDEIDTYTEELVQLLQSFVQLTVPMSKPSKHATRWWNQDIKQAIQEERRAYRHWKATQTEGSWQALTGLQLVKKRLITEAKRDDWRREVHKASASPEGLWKLAKWARTKSYLPPELNKIPDLQTATGLACRTTEKAHAFQARFYPTTNPDLSDLPSTLEFQDQTSDLPEPNWEVTSKELDEIIAYIKKDKAPGEDGIPNRFLAELGLPLSNALAPLFQQCLATGYYPAAFRRAQTVVLRKPGKATYTDPGSWRPIALLSTIGKLLETIIARRLSTVAEKYKLLPQSQMGNRKGRSTESALQLLTEYIHSVWLSKKHTASVLSLDISGAFDTVNHSRLLANLQSKKIPGWLIRWIRAFLTDRSTTLLIDGETTTPHQLSNGVPQGSPLSPILFLFYNGPLLEALDQPRQRLHPLGYADDVNLLTYSETETENCKRLERAHDICLKWAKTHGMKFAAAKYTLMHFSRRHQSTTSRAPVTIQETTIYPSQSARILGVEVDNKLRWNKHTDKIKQRLVTQMYALTRTTASTWGATLPKARQLYTAVIRSAIGYASPIWYTTGRQPGKKSNQTNRLTTHQNKALRIITGAYKATRIRQLETEAYIPPLDLWLSAKTAYFHRRLERSGMAQLILSLSAPIRRRVLQRKRKRTSLQPVVNQTPFEKARADTLQWFQADSFADCDGNLGTRVLRNWKTRWRQQATQLPGREQEQTSPRLVPQDTEPNKYILALHKDLRRAESSILIQARTECIGLNQFLYKRHVPGVDSPNCSCSDEPETVRHLVQYCPLYENKGVLNLSKTSPQRIDYRRLTGSPEGAKALARWLIDIGRLGQYAIARHLIC